MFTFFPLTLLIKYFSSLRYILLFGITAAYIFNGPKGSDLDAYERTYSLNCKGEFSTAFEPFYQFLTYVLGIFIGCQTLEMSTFLLTFFAMLLVINLLEYSGKKSDKYLSICVFFYYVITFQIAFNYRTGFASIFFLLSTIYFFKSNLNRQLFGLAAITTHIQTLPAALITMFFNSKSIYKVYFLVAAVLTLLYFASFIEKFVFDQFFVYLETYAGSYRLATIPYIFIYIFVLINLDRTQFSDFKYLIMFGLIINIVFLTNSHLASRITRPIEPILMMLFFEVLRQSKQFKVSSNISFIVALIPGMIFFLLYLFL